MSHRKGKLLAVLAAILYLALAVIGAPAQAADKFTPTTDFTDNGDGTVTHKLTGLTWMRCSIGQTWTGSTCTGTASDHTFDQAKAITSSFAGHSDWRLPSPWELTTIVDYDIASPGPTINATIFPNTRSSDFWSGSPSADGSDSAWYVDFYYGNAVNNYRSYSSVRLVRGGQSFVTLTTPSSDFTDNGDGTVTHKKTNLTWKRCSEGQTWTGATCSGTASTQSYDQAVALTSTFAGNSDWRIPSIQELLSIVEYRVYGPAINTTLFPNTPSSYFWSGSPYAGSSGYAWSVNFNYGHAYSDGRGFDFSVRLVRGGQYSASLPAAVIPAALILNVPTSLQSAGRAALGARADYSDNSTSKTVTPTWSSSNPAVASVSIAGMLTAGSVTADTPVTITATYTENGTTVTASKAITITAAASGLASLAISGNSSVQSGGQMLLKLFASYADGSTRQVTPTAWSVSDTGKGSVSSRGILSAGSVGSETTLTVTAGYTEGGLSKTASKIVTITVTPSTLSRLTLIGTRGTLAAGETLSLAAEGLYADGSRKRVIPSWSLAGSNSATINSSGLLTAGNVAADTPITITATYLEGGITATSSFSVLIQPTVASAPVTAEVEATGTVDNYTLALWVNTAESIQASQFSLTAATVPYSADAKAACTQQYGSSYRLADWGDLSAYFVAGGKLNQLVSTTGFDIKQNAWVTLNNESKYSADRKYEVSFHNHSVPVGFFVFDHLDNHYLDLGAWNDAIYALCFKPTSASRNVTRAGGGYNMYVAASLGQSFFVLNRSQQWQALALPLAEYLSGVESNTWQFVELLDSMDVRSLSGAQIYVGYGTSDSEMIAAGRYRVVYRVP